MRIRYSSIALKTLIFGTLTCFKSKKINKRTSLDVEKSGRIVFMNHDIFCILCQLYRGVFSLLQFLLSIKYMVTRRLYF